MPVMGDGQFAGDPLGGGKWREVHWFMVTV